MYKTYLIQWDSQNNSPQNPFGSTASFGAVETSFGRWRRTEAAADMKGANGGINSQLFKQRQSFEGAPRKTGLCL